MSKRKHITPLPPNTDRETQFNEKLKKSRGYHIVLNGVLLGTNATYAGALRTANNIGPEVEIVKRGK